MHILISLLAFLSFSQASPLSSLTALFRRAVDAEANPLSDGVTYLDGVLIADIPQALSTAQIVSKAISRVGWTVTCDSFQPGNECTKSIDGNASTFWHTEYKPINAPLPHWIMIDMQASYPVGNVTIEPRQDGNNNGHIGQHTIALSADGKTWGAPVAVGSYMDDATLKTTTFTPVNARYVNITAISEAGNRGPWTSIAEVNVYTGGSAAPAPAAGTFGSWGLTVDLPLVPVSASIEVATGRLLVWSSWLASDFHGTNGQTTITAAYDLTTQLVSEAVITNVGHDMFCEGLSIDFTGKIVAVGGNSDYATSLYDSTSNSWTKGGNLTIARGYQAQSTLSDGRTFTIGASWSGPHGGKNGEIYDPTTNKWTELNGCLVQPMLTKDTQDVQLGYLYRGDNHAWLFSWKNGSVLQAGPSSAMNWYGTAGTGTQVAAGTRASDPDSMCGNAVMYDAVSGSILTVGGAPDYTGSNATANAHIITISKANTNPVVTTINSMAYPRGFANSVILPDGQVLVIGGQSYAVPFTDVTAQYTPELWNPTTKKFTPMAPISMPRNYHSTAVLLPDGTVMSGGGGLCGACATNHWDAQIFSPAYLFNATTNALAARPSILSPTGTITVAVGGTFTITTSGAVSTLAIVRVTSTTHTVNTDQRRIVLPYTNKAGTFSYTATVPADPGVALPGYWMFFALTGNGVPSVSKFVKVTPAA